LGWPDIAETRRLLGNGITQTGAFAFDGSAQKAHLAAVKGGGLPLTQRRLSAYGKHLALHRSKTDDWLWGWGILWGAAGLAADVVSAKVQQVILS
jgi:hypothetical protein